MKIYMAAPYSARETVAQYAQECRTIGIVSTASWLDGKHEIDSGALGSATAYPDADVARWAAEDLADIDQADLLVAFTSASVGGGGTSGGRHVETGYALAQGKTVLLVGDPENVFHRIGPTGTLGRHNQPARVYVFRDWHATLIDLARRYAGLLGAVAEDGAA